MSLIGPSLKSTAPMLKGITVQAKDFAGTSAAFAAFSTYWGSGGGSQSTLFAQTFSTANNTGLAPAIWSNFFDDQIDSFAPTSTGPSTLVVQYSTGLALPNPGGASEYIAASLLTLGSTRPAQRDIVAVMQFVGSEEGNALQIWDRLATSGGTGVLASIELQDTGSFYVLEAELDKTVTGHGIPGTGFSGVSDNSASPFVIAPISTLSSTSTFPVTVKLSVNVNSYSLYIDGALQCSGTIPEISTNIGLGFGFGFIAGATPLPSKTGIKSFTVLTG